MSEEQKTTSKSVDMNKLHEMLIMKKLDRTIPTDFIEKMNELAKKDLRIGQMFEIIFNIIKSEGKDPFYVENDEMLIYIKNLLKTTVSELHTR